MSSHPSARMDRYCEVRSMNKERDGWGLLSAIGGCCDAHSSDTKSKPSPGFLQPRGVASQRASDLDCSVLNYLRHMADGLKDVRELYWGTIYKHYARQEDRLFQLASVGAGHGPLKLRNTFEG